MCRILAIIGKRREDAALEEFIQACEDYESLGHKKDIHELNRDETIQHKDGFGIALLYKEGFEVIKYSLPIFKCDLSTWFKEKVSFLMIHARRSSPGLEVKLSNNHPFYYSNGSEEFVFAHNGTIHNAIQNYDQMLFHPIGTTDSERYFYALLTEYFKRNDLSIEQINNVIKGWNYTGANFVFASKKYAWVYVSYQKHELYYTMKLYTSKNGLIISSAFLPSLGEPILLKHQAYLKVDIKNANIVESCNISS